MEVIFYNGCSEISAPYDLNGLDVQVSDFNQIVVFPNPVNDKIFLENLAFDSPIIIYNQDGMVSFSGVYEKGVDVSEFAPGLYFIDVDSQHFKFIKQ